MTKLGVVFLAVIATTLASPLFGDMGDMFSEGIGTAMDFVDQGETMSQQMIRSAVNIGSSFEEQGSKMAGEGKKVGTGMAKSGEKLAEQGIKMGTGMANTGENLAGQGIKMGTGMAKTGGKLAGQGIKMGTGMAKTGGKLAGQSEKIGKNVAETGSKFPKSLMSGAPTSPEKNKALSIIETILKLLKELKDKPDLKKECNPEDLIKKMTEVKDSLTKVEADKAKLVKQLTELSKDILSFSEKLAKKKEDIISSGLISKHEIETCQKHLKELTTSLQKLARSPPNVGDSPGLANGMSQDSLKSLDEVTKTFKKLKEIKKVEENLPKSVDLDAMAETISKIKEKVLQGKLDECKSQSKTLIKKIKLLSQVLNNEDVKKECPEVDTWKEKCKAALSTLEALKNHGTPDGKDKPSKGQSESNDAPTNANNDTQKSSSDSDTPTSSNDDNTDDANNTSGPEQASSDDETDNADDATAPEKKSSDDDTDCADSLASDDANDASKTTPSTGDATNGDDCSEE